MKQVATLAYQQLQEKQSLEKVLQQVTQVAPRVGKRFFQEGPIIQEVQKMFSEVVFCKGADRRRPLPKRWNLNMLHCEEPWVVTVKHYKGFVMINGQNGLR